MIACFEEEPGGYFLEETTGIVYSPDDAWRAARSLTKRGHDVGRGIIWEPNVFHAAMYRALTSQFVRMSGEAANT